MSDTTDSSSEREPDAGSGAPGGPDRGPGGEERDEAFLTQASSLIKTLKQGVVVTGERVQETIEDAVRRGRMTRKDAQELAAAIVSASRRQTDELRHELELLLERGRARKGRGEDELSSGEPAKAAKPKAGGAKAKPAAAKAKAEAVGAKAAKPKADTAKAAAKAKAKAGAGTTKTKPAATKAGASTAKTKPGAAKAKPKAKPANAKSTSAKSKATAATAAPFAGYDDLTAPEVGKRLVGLSAAQLSAVRGYEAAHAQRKTVLTAVDRRLAG